MYFGVESTVFKKNVLKRSYLDSFLCFLIKWHSFVLSDILQPWSSLVWASPGSTRRIPPPPPCVIIYLFSIIFKSSLRHHLVCLPPMKLRCIVTFFPSPAFSISKDPLIKQRQREVIKSDRIWSQIPVGSFQCVFQFQDVRRWRVVKGASVEQDWLLPLQIAPNLSVIQRRTKARCHEAS